MPERPADAPVLVRLLRDIDLTNCAVAAAGLLWKSALAEQPPPMDSLRDEVLVIMGVTA